MQMTTVTHIIGHRDDQSQQKTDHQKISYQQLTECQRVIHSALHNPRTDRSVSGQKSVLRTTLHRTAFLFLYYSFHTPVFFLKNVVTAQNPYLPFLKKQKTVSGKQNSRKR